jgi:hypothetical protein
MFQLILIIVCICCVNFAGCMSDTMKAAEKRGLCKQNLGAIFEQLASYSRTHNYFPLDNMGQLDLKTIFSQMGRTFDFGCPSAQYGSGYLFKRDITPGDLFLGDRFLVVAMDASRNHVVDRPRIEGEMEFVTLLYSNGSVITVRVDTSTAESWRSILKNGELIRM